MDKTNNSQKILFSLGTIYSIFYLIYFSFTLVNSIISTSLDFVLYVLIIITLLGAWGLWTQKRIFNKAFWKYFFIFQITFSICYFYSNMHQYSQSINDFVDKIFLFIPLYIAAYLYKSKSDTFWDTGVDMKAFDSNMLKKNFAFFIFLIFITINFNPFPKQEHLSVEQYKTLGYEAYIRGDLNAEKKYYMKGLAEAKRLHQEEIPVVAKIYHNLGVYYASKFNGKLSDYYTMRSLLLYQKLANQGVITKKDKDYGILGEDYYLASMRDDIKDDKLKIRYLSKAAEIFKEINDENGLSKCYKALGVFYTEKKDFELARQSFDQATSLAQDSNNLFTLAGIYKMRADSLYQEKKYRQAEEYVRMSINIFTKNGTNNIDEKQQLGHSYMILGKIQAAEGRCDESKENYTYGASLMSSTVVWGNLVKDIAVDEIYEKCRTAKAGRNKSKLSI